MANILKFDVENLARVRDECDSYTEMVREAKASAQRTLQLLQKDWNTPAGRKFFETVDQDWPEVVDQYAKVLGDLEKALNKAIREYQDVKQKAERLKMQ